MEQKIVVLGTGGTIAGVASDASDAVGYVAAQIGIAQLLEGVPGLAEAAGALEVEQVAQVDSKDMDTSVWATLVARCLHHLADPQVCALVITHGTDTLEETAWFLQQVLPAGKPVVLTSAMRPATAVSPDGPPNLLDAVAVARSAGARGVLAVAAGEVHGARSVQKVHPYRLHAFASGDEGPLGFVEDGTVRWVKNPPAVENVKGHVAINQIVSGAEWPRVEVVLSHAGCTGGVVDALLRAGVQGLVVACTGNGTVHQALQSALERAQAAGVQVVRASRCPLGQIVPTTGGPFPVLEGLSPVKARISLALQCMERAQ